MGIKYRIVLHLMPRVEVHRPLSGTGFFGITSSYTWNRRVRALPVDGSGTHSPARRTPRVTEGVGVVFRAGASGPLYVGVSSGDSGSVLAPWAYRSFQETDSCPPHRPMLEEILRLQPYQSDPNDPACAARIEHLRASIEAYEEVDAVPEWNPRTGTSIRSFSTSARGANPDEGRA